MEVGRLSLYLLLEVILLISSELFPITVSVYLDSNKKLLLPWKEMGNKMSNFSPKLPANYFLVEIYIAPEDSSRFGRKKVHFSSCFIHSPENKGRFLMY